MKAIAFNGSARKDGNTAIMTGWLFDELEKEGIETELYWDGENHMYDRNVSFNN